MAKKMKKRQSFVRDGATNTTCLQYIQGSYSISECVYVTREFISSPTRNTMQAVEPIASGWLKVRRNAELPEQDGHLPLLSMCMTIVWRLAIRGSKRWGRQLFEFSWWLKGLGSGTHSSNFSWRRRLNSVDQPLGRDCCPDSSRGLGRRPRVCQEGKTGLALGDFKFPVLVLCLTYRAPALRNFWCIEELMRGQNTEKGFTYVGLVLCLFSFFESSLCILFWEFWCASFKL
jgi:hypothetical protein